MGHVPAIDLARRQVRIASLGRRDSRARARDARGAGSGFFALRPRFQGSFQTAHGRERFHRNNHSDSYELKKDDKCPSKGALFVILR
jgi:hypothetical protein